MGYRVDYRTCQRSKPKKQKCNCGNATYQPEGVCILCMTGIGEMSAALGPAGPVPKALAGGGRTLMLRECPSCGNKFRARGNTKYCKECRVAEQRTRSTAWYHKSPANRRKKLEYQKEYQKKKRRQ